MWWCSIKHESNQVYWKCKTICFLMYIYLFLHRVKFTLLVWVRFDTCLSVLLITTILNTPSSSLKKNNSIMLCSQMHLLPSLWQLLMYFQSLLLSLFQNVVCSLFLSFLFFFIPFFHESERDREIDTSQLDPYSVISFQSLLWRIGTHTPIRSEKSLDADQEPSHIGQPYRTSVALSLHHCQGPLICNLWIWLFRLA